MSKYPIYFIFFLFSLLNIQCKTPNESHQEPIIDPTYSLQYEDMKSVNTKNNVISSAVKDTTNRAFKINELTKNHITVIKLWATWCSPCIESMPKFESLQEQYKEFKNIRFITVSIDQKYEHWKEMIDRKKWHLDQYWAGQNEKSKIYHLTYGIHENMVIATLPNYLILDKDGRILENLVTNKDTEIDLKKSLERIIN